MALSAPAVRRSRPADLVQPQVVNAAVVYPGGYTAWANQNHATSASRGRTLPWTGAAGQIPAGFCDAQTPVLGSTVTGTTGNTSASPITRVGIDGAGRIVERCAVTGLAGTIADVNKLVYATDDTTFSLVYPSAPNQTPVGIVVDFVSSTLAHVEFFSRQTLLAMALAGGGSTTWCMGALSAALASSANMLTGIVAPCHGRIRSVYAICTNPPTDADMDISVNLEIGGTNVTGGVITLLHGDTQGLKKSGTAVTDDGGNVFHAGDLIDVEGVVNTATTSTDVGLYNLYVQYSYEPGL